MALSCLKKFFEVCTKKNVNSKEHPSSQTNFGSAKWGRSPTVGLKKNSLKIENLSWKSFFGQSDMKYTYLSKNKKYKFIMVGINPAD